VIAAALRGKVISGGVDEAAVLFYDARDSKNDKGLFGINVLQAPDVPDVGRIKQLEVFTDADFTTEVGSAGSTQNSEARALALSNAINMANVMFNDRKAKAKMSFRVMVFTRSQKPGPIM
jgi:hypothetical protein